MDSAHVRQKFSSKGANNNIKQNGSKTQKLATIKPRKEKDRACNLLSDTLSPEYFARPHTPFVRTDC